MHKINNLRNERFEPKDCDDAANYLKYIYQIPEQYLITKDIIKKNVERLEKEHGLLGNIKMISFYYLGSLCYIVPDRPPFFKSRIHLHSLIQKEVIVKHGRDPIKTNFLEDSHVDVLDLMDQILCKIFWYINCCSIKTFKKIIREEKLRVFTRRGLGLSTTRFLKAERLETRS